MVHPRVHVPAADEEGRKEEGGVHRSYVHFPSLVLDGVYRATARETVRFSPLRARTAARSSAWCGRTARGVPSKWWKKLKLSGYARRGP